MKTEDMRQFMDRKFDFGKAPVDYPLTEDQKQISVLAMAINAAIVQLILEGLFPADEQLHLMGHLQDFANRLYNGESILMPGTGQTLQVNSKAGNLFYEASIEAFKNGTQNFEKVKQVAKELAEERQDNNPTQEQFNAKPTLH